jgi:hypothetical protein
MLRPTLSLEDFEASLNAAFTDRYRPYAGAMASFAYTPGNRDGAELVSCRWEFADVPRTPRTAVTYPALILEESWFPMGDAAGELLRILGGETVLGGCLLHEPVDKLELIDTERQTFTGWRETVFEGSLKGHSYLYDRTPVVAKGLRPYPSILLAVNDWVWKRDDPHGFISAFDLGKLHIVLPDTRARIRKARWVGNTLMLENERNAAPEDVELQGVLMEGQTSMVLPSGLVEMEVEWEVPAEAEGIEVYLVHRDGTLLSHRKLKRGEHYRPRPGDFAAQDRTEEELRQGENERVEYKPFIVREHKKEQELIETVIAFSNTFGGRIYVGVEDDGTLEGEAQLRKIGKADEKKSLSLMVSQIKKLIRERITPVPDIDVSPAVVFGHPIVVVAVPAGENAPYCTFDNDVYVRRGASNRKPNPLTELPLVVERARERRDRRMRQEQIDGLDASSYQKGDD